MRVCWGARNLIGVDAVAWLHLCSRARTLWFAALAIPLICVTSIAHGVAYRIQSETTGDAYQLVTSDNELIHRYRLHQYLGFGAHDLLSDGEYQLSVNP